LKGNPPPFEANLEAIKFLTKDKGERVSNLKANQANKEEIVAAISELRKFKNQLLTLLHLGQIPTFYLRRYGQNCPYCRKIEEIYKKKKSCCPITSVLPR
jgi:hypothetical protein